MWLGIPYDSDEGRSIAAVLTALLTGIAYKTSADLADKIGEFDGFENNKEPMFKVLNQHFEHVKKLPTTLNNNKYQFYEDIHQQSLNIWTNLQKRSKFRNAQTTLTAPTGTISFLMNSITTGIEPEYSLVRYKRLTGSNGATIMFVNQIVNEALKNMGYNDQTIPQLVKELIGELPEGTPSLFKGKDKDVFLTASYLPGTKLCIDYMGHIKMCAAIQPFLSASMSKTINLPNDISVDEIYDLYIKAWKMGLKGITVYRDGSKNFQPLTTKNLNKETEVKKLVRRKLPDERPAITHKFRIGNSDG